MYIVRNVKNNVYLEKIMRGIYHFGFNKEDALRFKYKREIEKIFKTDKFEIVKVK